MINNSLNKLLMHWLMYYSSNTIEGSLVILYTFHIGLPTAYLAIGQSHGNVYNFVKFSTIVYY